MDFLAELACVRRWGTASGVVELTYQGPDWLLWMWLAMFLLILPVAFIIDKHYTNIGFPILLLACFLTVAFISQNYCVQVLR